MNDCWSCLGAVDVAALAALLPALRWPRGRPGQPGRLPVPPAALPAVAAVLAWFPGCRADLPTASLARTVPGQAFPPHRDGQPAGWVTLVHVAVVTTPGAWHLFADEGTRFHMEAGQAYRFDTRRLHSYGNDGPGDRVHLLFDVILEGDASRG